MGHIIAHLTLLMGNLVTSPEVAAYRVFTVCEHPDLVEQVDAPGMLQMLKQQGEAFNQGDMRYAEQMLAAQATALQTLFGRLTERAMDQSHMPNLESFMRLALRAQSQCRATLEALSALKNPPVIYAKQVNQTTGPQQINNSTAAPSQAQQTQNAPNKLLEADNGKRLDARATGTAGSLDPVVDAMGEIEWTAHS